MEKKADGSRGARDTPELLALLLRATSPTQFFTPDVGCQFLPAVPPVGNWQKPAAMGIDIIEIRSNVLAEGMEDNWNDSPDCQGAKSYVGGVDG